MSDLAALARVSLNSPDAEDSDEDDNAGKPMFSGGWKHAYAAVSLVVFHDFIFHRGRDYLDNGPSCSEPSPRSSLESFTDSNSCHSGHIKTDKKEKKRTRSSSQLNANIFCIHLVLDIGFYILKKKSWTNFWRAFFSMFYFFLLYCSDKGISSIQFL